MTAGQMKMGGRGLLLVAGLLKGDPVEGAHRAEEAKQVLSMHLEDENIEVLTSAVVCLVAYVVSRHSRVFKKRMMI